MTTVEVIGAIPTPRGWATLTVEADGDEHAVVSYRRNRWVTTRRELAHPLVDLTQTRKYAEALVLLAGGQLGNTHNGVLNAPAPVVPATGTPQQPADGYRPDSPPDRAYLHAMFSDRSARFLIVPNRNPAPR